jgi:hypothetical protein
MRFLLPFCAFVLICLCHLVDAMDLTKPEANETVLSQDIERVVSHQNTANIVLGTWSTGSITLGVFQLFSPNPFVKAFGMQNLAWGSIDGGIAMYGHRNLNKMDWSITTAVDEKLKFRRILLINALLDFLYLAVGFLLWRSAKINLRGHGIGILVQGGFLLIFDWVNYALTF